VGSNFIARLASDCEFSMRRMVLAFAISIFAWPVYAEGPYSTCAVVIRPAEIWDTVYTARPAMRTWYVAFTTEPMEFVIQIANRSDDSVTLDPGGMRPADLFTVTVKRDGEIIPMAVIVENEVLERGRAFTPRAVAWDDRIPVAGRHSIEVRASAHGRLEPGIYEFEVTSRLIDEHGKPLAPLGARLPMDVRAVTPETRVETLRRRALLAFGTRDFSASDRVISQILTISPNNVVALMMRGDIAVAARRTTEAVGVYDRAIAILESDDDRDYLRWNDRRNVADFIDVLRRKRAALLR